MHELSSHPIQSIGYGTLLGIIFFMLFVIILVITFYFLFGAQVNNIVCGLYCPLIDPGSQYCTTFCEAPTFENKVNKRIKEKTLSMCEKEPCAKICTDSDIVGEIDAEAHRRLFQDECKF